MPTNLDHPLVQAAADAWMMWEKAIASKSDGKLLTTEEKIARFLDTSPAGEARRQRLWQEKTPQELGEYAAHVLGLMELQERRRRK